MNTNKLHFVVILMIAMFTASCKDDIDHTIITPEQLPEKTTTFLAKYFQDDDIISANKYDIDITNKEHLYLVNLKDNIQLHFNNEGEWLEINTPNGLSEAGKEIIFEKLPSYVDIKEEFNNYYSNQKITRLVNDTDDEIQFILDNKYSSYIIDAHEGTTYADMYAEGRYVIPEKILETINTQFKSTTRETSPKNKGKLLRFNGHRGQIYRFIDYDNTLIDFYQNGDWFYITNKNGVSINKSRLINVLSNDIRTTLKDNFESATSTTTSITRYNNASLYGFYYQENKFALISKDNEIIESPLDKAKEYIAKHFTSNEDTKFYFHINTGGAYYLRYSLLALSPNSEVRIQTDYQGNMRRISAGPITSTGTGIVPIPSSILDTMPKAALDYINENHPDSPIIVISYNHSKDHDDISEEFSFAIHIPNNLKYISFNSVSGEYISEFNVLPTN